jgi:septal ring factor EnvC (AmiA/AmiB activator)
MVDFSEDDYKIPRRLDLVERDLRDHAKSFTALTNQAATLQDRINALEQAFRKWEIADARAEERSVRNTERLKNIEDEIEALRGVGTKLLWIVAGGVLTAFMAFVLKGGLVL